MKKVQWLIQAMMIFHHSQAESTLFVGLSETHNNNQPIIISHGCTSHGIIKYFGTEIENDEISIYVSVYFSLFTLPPCMQIYVEAGTFPSGNYTINYYISEKGRPSYYTILPTL
ncbi:MAG: hypothetical protein JAZ18_17305 [Candidatus Thiodiazotropha endolucinida]|nr:hypothetical protein [Candidatus Thiodiazotropha endolucinida]